MMKDNEDLAKKFDLFLPHLDEKTKRLYVGSEALSLGRGGIAIVKSASGISRSGLPPRLRDTEIFRHRLLTRWNGQLFDLYSPFKAHTTVLQERGETSP